MTTISNGAIIVGETYITLRYTTGFAQQSTNLHHGSYKEGQPKNRDVSSVRRWQSVSQRLEDQTQSWHNGPVNTAVIMHAAQQAGGTARRDKAGRRRRKRGFSLKDAKKSEEAQGIIKLRADSLDH